MLSVTALIWGLLMTTLVTVAKETFLKKYPVHNRAGRHDREGKEIKLPEVLIVVDGGIADVKEKPSEVKVIIRDYDIEGIEEDKLVRDPDGLFCRESIFE